MAFEKKISFAKKTDTANQKKRKKPKRLLQSQLKKKESFSFFYQSSSVPIKHKQTKRKVSFSSDFSFKITFKPHKRQEFQFPSQEYNQNGEHPLKGNQYCINIFFYSFLYYLLFFLLFCLISYLIQFIFIFVLIIY